MSYRYLGNKTRLASKIVAAIATEVPRGAVIADPMCGTAAVSAALAEQGYSVVAADELTFATLHAHARLLLSAPPPVTGTGHETYEGALAFLNSVAPADGFFTEEYSSAGRPRNGSRARRYFTPENAGRIDAVRAQIRAWRDVLPTSTHKLLLHDLILAVNDVANIAGTYGYYRSEWNRAALRPLVLQPSVFSASTSGHAVHQGKVEELASLIEADACYLDPPYTKRQYAGNYHILETIALEDFPDPVGDGGLRDWYDQYSAFCSRRSVTAAFEQTLANLDVHDVFVSYSEDGLLNPEQLERTLSRFGKVQRHDFALPRFRSNGGKKAAVTEHLYHVRAAKARAARPAGHRKLRQLALPVG
jgi:adenine-specific DNA-methyltransferase